MKKIILSLFLAGSMLTSCDMNTEPDGSIIISEGIQKMDDVITERNGLYSFLRSRSGGSYTGICDLQSDLFIGTMQNGNSYTSFTTGNIQSNDGDIEGIWQGLLSGIMQTNYFLQYVDEFRNNSALSATDNASIDRYLAEAHFMRAYYNYLLTYYYCGKYDASTANNPATGIPLCLVYNPSSDRGTYPGRSTLNETYTQIEKDIEIALTGLQTFEQTNKSCLVMGGGGYLNSYAVKALKARVALMKGDYTTAEATAKDVALCQYFPLTQAADYENMWLNDTGDELIFQPYGDASQAASIPATGSIFNQMSPLQAKFIPSAAIIASYADDDIRLAAFMSEKEVTYNGADLWTPWFNKYPGNSIFDAGSSTSTLKNKPKPFRNSEQYLIWAEAAAMLGHTADANEALNSLRAARIPGFEDQNYNGNVLIDQIRQERAKELIGEGFRIGDLRRWDLGFTRDGSYDATKYPDMSSYIVNLALQCVYSAGDYRYTWPIPSAEMQTNPQLAGQQNPGY